MESSQVLIWENVVTYKIHLSLIDCTNASLEPLGHDKDAVRENYQIIHIDRYTSCNEYSSYVLITYYASHALYVSPSK